MGFDYTVGPSLSFKQGQAELLVPPQCLTATNSQNSFYSQ